MTKNNLNDYEKAVLKFFAIGFLSEFSKTAIFFVIFYSLGLHKEFLAALVFLLAFRIFSGGIHFKKYTHCLIASFLLLAGGIALGMNMFLPKLAGIIIAIGCSIPIYLMSPVQAKSRPQPTPEVIKSTKIRAMVMVYLFIAIYIASKSTIYVNIGFWLLVIHTVQLFVAYIKK